MLPNETVFVVSVSVGVTMSASKQEDNRRKVEIFRELHPGIGKAKIVKHFVSIGFKRRWVYKTLDSLERGCGSKRKSGSGRPKVKLDNNEKRSLKRALDSKVGLSFNSLAKRYGVSDKTMKRIVVDMNYEVRKQKSAPEVNPGQEQRQRRRLSTLFKGTQDAPFKLDIIMDDESYYPFQPPHPTTYFVKKGETPQDEKRFHRKAKFTQKMMVWLAISQKGPSEPFYMQSKGAMNSAVYITECIEKRLVPYIQKHYPNNEGYIFWPDLATAHYSHQTQARLTELGINFVPKDNNPPNVPQLRPIEKFWAYHKRLVYAHGWRAKSTQGLINRMQKILDEVPDSYWPNLMSSVHSKVRRAAKYGAHSAL